MGKTEAVIAFANEHLSDFSIIWWISESRLEEQYRNPPRQLGIDINNEDSFQVVREKVHQVLEESTFEKPWLILYDNFQEDIEIPQRGGCVLITSRSKDLWGTEAVEAKVLTHEESMQHFEEITKEPRSSEMHALATLLGGYPLILNQVARTIHSSRTEYTIAKYYKALQDTGLEHKLGELPQVERYKLTMREVWRLFREEIGQDSNVVKWIEVCSHFSSDPIPIDWLTTWLKVIKKVPDAAASSEEIVRTLDNRGVVKFAKTAQTVALHAVKQAAIRNEISESLKESFDPSLFDAQLLMHFAAFKLNLNFHNWEKIVSLKKHAFELLGAQQKNELRAVFEALPSGPHFALGLVGQIEGKYEQAADHFIRALGKFQGCELKVEEISMLRQFFLCHNNVGICFKYCGSYEVALKHFQFAKKVVDKMHSLDPSDETLGLYVIVDSNIANLRSIQGEFEIEIIVRGQLFELASRVYPKSTYPNGTGELADTIYSLGRAHFNLLVERHKLHYLRADKLLEFHLKKAEEFTEQALNMRLTIYPEGHLDTVQSLQLLARLRLLKSTYPIQLKSSLVQSLQPMQEALVFSAHALKIIQDLKELNSSNKDAPQLKLFESIALRLNDDILKSISLISSSAKCGNE